MSFYFKNLFRGMKTFAKIDWNVFAANDIQSRCRNLREMKDVFKELKVLGRERKSCTAQN